MDIAEAGHVYLLRTLGGDGTPEKLTFVNREDGRQHPGTQTQEVIRALIDRTRHCDRCLRWDGNDLIIHHLRMALVLHECRALMRKTEKGELLPEFIAVDEDGHFELNLEIPSRVVPIRSCTTNDAVLHMRSESTGDPEGRRHA